MGAAYSISNSLASGFQHFDSGGGQVRASSDYMIEGLLRQAVPGFGSVTIINADDNSSAVSTSTNIQHHSDPSWAVKYEPIYKRRWSQRAPSR